MTLNQQLPRAEAQQLSTIVDRHVAELVPALDSLALQSRHLAAWGATLAHRLWSGGRLLVAGNGGSAAEAQHLSAEIVGRYLAERPAFSAIALHADTSSLTAIGNDYGFDQVFSRQVAAHGRTGDILLLLSTSGRSENLLQAAREAQARGIHSWAMTGTLPNPLAAITEEHIALAGTGASVQEAQLVAIHALCACFDLEIDRLGRAGHEALA
ncbi:phosphoheptose isomerase [Arthrobacter psychrolactophilus]|uniref:Phosphoheptose isomerase n=1 Tax=Arthrobacter psychrolactophilus TaxID=92442 RepID=A0A2V5IMC6_9MICC|nr:SIS domain-containing protein [Arthrobacter psychrolactophilus]PYI37271.1 phosphoheptose isomerase [Arthrobacter psychrolactophilus]